MSFPAEWGPPTPGPHDDVLLTGCEGGAPYVANADRRTRVMSHDAGCAANVDFRQPPADVIIDSRECGDPSPNTKFLQKMKPYLASKKYKLG